MHLYIVSFFCLLSASLWCSGKGSDPEAVCRIYEETTPHYYDNAIVISGPDIDDAVEIIAFLKKRIPLVEVIGDGKVDIIDEEGKGPWYDGLVRIYSNALFRDPNAKTLVVLNLHGLIKEDKHVVLFSKKLPPEPSSEFFEGIARIVGHAVDLLHTSCYSGGSLDDLELLPEGSQAMFTAPKEAVSLHFDMAPFENYFSKDRAFSLESFYPYYFYRRGAPSPIWVDKDGWIWDMNEVENLFGGKVLPKKAYEYIKNRVEEFCDEAGIDRAPVLAVLNYLEVYPLNLRAFPNDKRYAYAFIEGIWEYAAWLNTTQISSTTCPSKLGDNFNTIAERYNLPLVLNLEGFSNDEEIDEEPDTMDDVMVFLEKKDALAELDVSALLETLGGEIGFFLTTDPSVFESEQERKVLRLVYYYLGQYLKECAILELDADQTSTEEAVLEAVAAEVL